MADRQADANRKHKFKSLQHEGPEARGQGGEENSRVSLGKGLGAGQGQKRVLRQMSGRLTELLKRVWVKAEIRTGALLRAVPKAGLLKRLNGSPRLKVGDLWRSSRRPVVGFLLTQSRRVTAHAQEGWVLVCPLWRLVSQAEREPLLEGEQGQ